MKKFLIILVTLPTLSCLPNENKSEPVRKIVRERDNKEGMWLSNNYIDAVDYKIQGMHYKVFHSGSPQGGSFIINVTKDSLEVSQLIRESKYGR